MYHQEVPIDYIRKHMLQTHVVGEFIVDKCNPAHLRLVYKIMLTEIWIIILCIV